MDLDKGYLLLFWQMFWDFDQVFWDLFEFDFGRVSLKQCDDNKEKLKLHIMETSMSAFVCVIKAFPIRRSERRFAGQHMGGFGPKVSCLQNTDATNQKQLSHLDSFRGYGSYSITSIRVRVSMGWFLCTARRKMDGRGICRNPSVRI